MNTELIRHQIKFITLPFSHSFNISYLDCHQRYDFISRFRIELMISESLFTVEGNTQNKQLGISSIQLEMNYPIVDFLTEIWSIMVDICTCYVYYLHIAEVIQISMHWT